MQVKCNMYVQHVHRSDFFDVFLTSFNTKNIKIGDPRMECYTYMYQTMNKLQVYMDKI